MTLIAPAVLAATTEEYKESLQKIHTFATRVHADLSDGMFAPTPTIAPNQIWWPQGWEVDIHAMVADPAAYVDILLPMTPHLIIFHAEAKTDLLTIIQKIKASGVKAGVALQKTTVPSDVAPLIEAADHVMIFSGELGKYGGTASLMQLEKVRLVRNINAAVEIGWDGGVTVENAYSLSQGGVDVLYVGSAIQKAEDSGAAFAALTAEINKQGAM
jgi:ribulose-phosphate 3-epimerase